MSAVSSRGTTLAFGAFGLKADESVWIKANQLESARRAMARLLRTAKSAEVGMGGGRGGLSHFVAVVEAGRVLFEIDGVPESVARQAMLLAAHKLPVKTRFVKRTH
jgi:large subunit ribosomal protein L16